MTVACLELKLTPSEALAAVTINAAAALGLGDEVGSIETGRQADLAIWSVPTHRQIPYWPAADLIRAVIKRGRVVLERASVLGPTASGASPRASEGRSPAPSDLAA